MVEFFFPNWIPGRIHDRAIFPHITFKFFFFSFLDAVAALWWMWLSSEDYETIACSFGHAFAVHWHLSKKSTMSCRGWKKDNESQLNEFLSCQLMTAANGGL